MESWKLNLECWSETFVLGSSFSCPPVPFHFQHLCQVHPATHGCCTGTIIYWPLEELVLNHFFSHWKQNMELLSNENVGRNMFLDFKKFFEDISPGWPEFCLDFIVLLWSPPDYWIAHLYHHDWLRFCILNRLVLFLYFTVFKLP